MNQTLPVAMNGLRTSWYFSSGASTNCSCEQMMPLSNDAPRTIFSTASLMIDVAIDDDRHVARADAERRPAGRVRRLHHRAAAGGDDDVDGLHQFLRRFNRALLHHLNEVVRPAVGLHDLHERVGEMLGALLGLRMRRKDDGVAGLDARTSRCTSA